MSASVSRVRHYIVSTDQGGRKVAAISIDVILGKVMKGSNEKKVCCFNTESKV